VSDRRQQRPVSARVVDGFYGTGMCRAEIARLKIADIDSPRMVIHVVNGKGGKDRDFLCQAALRWTGTCGRACALVDNGPAPVTR
jgi:site-specific recombinase XerD